MRKRTGTAHLRRPDLESWFQHIFMEWFWTRYLILQKLNGLKCKICLNQHGLTEVTTRSPIDFKDDMELTFPIALQRTQKEKKDTMVIKRTGLLIVLSLGPRKSLNQTLSLGRNPSAWIYLETREEKILGSKARGELTWGSWAGREKLQP